MNAMLQGANQTLLNGFSIMSSKLDYDDEERANDAIIVSLFSVSYFV